MGASPIYVVYNVFYQITTFCLLAMANSTVNADFIPATLTPESPEAQLTGLVLFGNICFNIILLFFEGAFLIMVITVINQLVLKATGSDKKRKLLVRQTTALNIILTFFFTIIFTWGHFMGGLW
jgi:Mg/Co/Ni transporter MgtE